MSDVGLLDDDAIELAVAAIDAWIAHWLAEGSFLLAAERQRVTDGTATHQWYLRFAGEEKDVITVWATLRQRTLFTEAQMLPAPEANVEEVLRYLMRCNAELYAMAYALGPEDAIYLMGRTSAIGLDEEALDRIFGSAVHYLDAHFAQAASLGFPDWRRKRRRRS